LLRVCWFSPFITNIFPTGVQKRKKNSFHEK
jgi:hypothetical protein